MTSREALGICALMLFCALSMAWAAIKAERGVKCSSDETKED